MQMMHVIRVTGPVPRRTEDEPRRWVVEATDDPRSPTGGEHAITTTTDPPAVGDRVESIEEVR